MYQGKSPCTGHCQLDPQTSQLCLGCYRSMDDILAWGSLGAAQRHERWQAAWQRKAQSHPPYHCRDQLGRQLSLARRPRSLVSLVPSITATLIELGFGQQLVGVTSYCPQPDPQVAVVGGTKNPRVSRIVELNPELVVANKEENSRSHVEQLHPKNLVWVSEVKSLVDAVTMVEGLSDVLGCYERGFQLQKRMMESIDQVSGLLAGSCCYMIWKQPWMVAGGDTFIHHWLSHLGLENIFANHSRYPEVSIAEIQRLRPRYVMLSTEPYSFQAEHVTQLQQQLEHSKVVLVDGAAFSWFGSPMIRAAQYFSQLSLNW